MHVLAVRHFPFLSRWVIACVYVHMCVCALVCGELSHCARSEPLVASLWWDPDGNLRWTAHSANHYCSPSLLFFFYFCPRLFKILSRSNGRTQTTARSQSLHLHHLGERGSFFTCHLTLPCLVLSFSHICTTCSLSDTTPRRAAHIKRRQNTFFVSLTPPRFIRTTQTRSKDPLKSRLFY